MKRLLTARRALRLAIPCRDTRGMHYTKAIFGDSMGALLIITALIIGGALALMGG